MGKLTVSLFIVLLVFNMLMLASAEQILEPTSIGENSANLVIPQDTLSPQEKEIIDNRTQRESLFGIIIWFIAFLSIIITFFIGKFMVKINPKKTNLILNSLILVGALALSIAQTIDWSRWLSMRNWQVFDAGVLIWLLPSYIGLIASTLIIWKGKTYAKNMSISAILGYLVFISISFIFEMVYGVIYDLPATLGIAILIVPIGLSLYAILGLVGAIIDKKKRKLR